MDAPPETAEDRADAPRARRRVGIALLLVLVGFVVWDVLWVIDLFDRGSPEEIDHARDRLGDPLLGPNAP